MSGRPQKKISNHLQILLEKLGINAKILAKISGVDYTLVSKWQAGSRRLSRRSSQLAPVAATFARMDRENKLDSIILPYMQQGESKAEAIAEYLVTEDVMGLAPHTVLPTIQRSGEYVAEYRVFLGTKGFRKATLAMMDYLLTLPPGQEVIVLCQGRYDLFTKNLPFVFTFITRLKKAIKRGTRLQLINRKGYSVIDIAAFTGTWLFAHLQGYIRSRYYEGEMPEDLRFVASIPGYWSARVEEDREVEDNLYTAMRTDPRDIRRDQKLCAEYLEKSKPASQYRFLENPCGDDENDKLWQSGPLPKWGEQGSRNPKGNFYAVSRVPGFGMITKGELCQILNGETPPDMPDYLFPQDAAFVPGAHRIILCREDMRAGLKKERRMHETLSAMLHRRVFVTREMLSDQTKRLIEAMKRGEFEVAIVPRTAFQKIQTEMIAYEHSVSVAWLQDMTESVFADDKATSGSFHSFIDYTWGRLMVGWKRKSTVHAQLRKWLNGKELDKKDNDSAVVKHWNMMPKR